MSRIWEINAGRITSAMQRLSAPLRRDDVMTFGGGSLGGQQPGGSQGPLMIFTVHHLQPDEYKTSGNSIVNRNTVPGSSISLYLPAELSVTYSTQYEEMEMGSVLGALDNGAMAGLGAAASKLADNAKKMLGEATGLGAGVAELSKANEGKAFNPQMELLFKNVNFRTFTFNYKFHPANKLEAIEVQRIQKTFKKNMLPTISGSSGYFDYPSMFALEYRSGARGGDDYYHKFTKMVLTDMSINYAGTGVASQFYDGAPVETDMSLTFKEVEFLTADMIDQGY